MVPSTAPKLLSCTKYCGEKGSIFRSGSFAPLDTSSWTLESARPTQKFWTLGHRCFVRAVIKLLVCTNFGGAVVSALRADTELLEWCQALQQRPIAVMKFTLALVWRCLCGTNAISTPALVVYRYRNASLSPFCARWRTLSKFCPPPLSLPFKERYNNVRGTRAFGVTGDLYENHTLW